MTVLDLPAEYTLGDDESVELRQLAAEVSKQRTDPTAAEFYDQQLPRLPEKLGAFLEDFRRSESSAACLIHNLPIDEDAIGPTPPHWEAALDKHAAQHQEIYLALCGVALGEPFTWATLQRGRLIQNILPIQGDEKRQNGHGSGALLEFHTEDGFHPQRCDYLLLMGMRNGDQVPTILSSVRDVRLSAEDRRILSEDRYFILPDDEHIRQLEHRGGNPSALAKMRQMQQDPEATAVLFGNRIGEYLRIDRPFMRCVGNDRQAERALDHLMAELERVQQDVVVGRGDLLVVDNYQAVHGRRSFKARYDGTDRWLKKLTVSRNLRRGLVGSDNFRIRL